MSMASVGGWGKVDLGKVVALEQLPREIGEFVEAAAEGGMSMRDFERNLLDQLLRLGFAATEQFLALQGNGDRGETVTDDDGQTLYRSAEPAARPLRTIFGPHLIQTYVYRQRRHPNTPIVLRPVDAQLGIEPDRWSPLLQEFTQLFCVEQAFDLAAQSFEAIFRQKLSVDTLERVNQRMGEQAAEFLENLDAPPLKEEGELLVQTADGKGVPLVREEARRLRCFEEKSLRSGNRRMATLASVYSVDRYVRTPEEIVAALFRDEPTAPAADPPPRPEPRHKRMIARFPQIMADVDPTEPISGAILALTWAAREVEKRRRPDQVLIRLMDGQHSLWDTADACGDVPEHLQVDILDIVHVSSYVWRAAKVFHHHREHQEAFARERLLRILRGEVKGVIAGLKRMASRHALRGTARQEIDTVCGYFASHAERMNYDVYLAAGYPIATGVIEGACRHLVKDRMERSGMRWTVDGAQAMLNVRALHQSSYWNEFHQLPTSNGKYTTTLNS